MKTKKREHFAFILPAIFAAMTLFTSCSNDESSNENYECTTCQDTPDALAANDGIAKGVYKGIVVGSSGTISIDVQNGSSNITATMNLDGTTTVLTSSVALVDGQNYVAPFTGTFNGSPVSITFQVEFNGNDPIIVSSNIPGHPNASFELYKETSTSLIEAFEGSFTKTGDGSGTFNIVMARNFPIPVWRYIAKLDGDTETSTGEGTFDAAGNLLDEEGYNIGTITGDVLEGTSTTGSGSTLTISGNRTL